MPHLPEDTDLESWHRYFAMENNNRGWQLAGQSSRSDAEAEEMLNAAHTSALHWSKVGTELNTVRAKLLLAEVHALLDLGSSALELSSTVRDYFMAREPEDWELAFVHSIHAHSAAVAGQPGLHLASYEAAAAAIDAIADEEDRKIVLQTFNQVPRP